MSRFLRISVLVTRIGDVNEDNGVHFQIAGKRIAVNIPDAAALEAAVEQRLSAGQGFALATINLDHLVKLRSDTPFRLAYAAQDFVVADGNPIVWLSRLARRPVSLVPGSDMVVPLARLAARLGISVALLGSTPEALRKAADGLCDRVPGLKVAAMIAPPMGFDPMGEDADAMFAEIAASGARLCFVALGAPKQEILAARGRSHAPSVGFCSIGAGLDFIAGHQVRAPAWVRGLALEWVWRMLSSPRRLVPRYARCVAILPAETAHALALRRQ
jgi:N-acetylglucosaminyldiphosphoundecaprenol N-acetyl-beta-D-mannosaminyltransferase